MTRLYLEGRTETVRPVTMESAAFVRSMTNPQSTVSEKKIAKNFFFPQVSRYTVFQPPRSGHIPINDQISGPSSSVLYIEVPL